jgi:hypothetical protein
VTSPSGQDYFFTPAPSSTPGTPEPVRFGYAAPHPVAPVSAVPVAATRSVGWLLGVGVAVLLLVGAVIGVVALAHKDKHTEGNTILRPIQQAQGVALDSDLQSAEIAEQTYLAEHGSYTTDLSAAGYRANGGVRVTVVSASATDFCLEATKPGDAAPRYDSRSGGLSVTPCR